MKAIWNRTGEVIDIVKDGGHSISDEQLDRFLKSLGYSGLEYYKNYNQNS